MGEVLLRVNARDVVQQCGQFAQDLARNTAGSEVEIPNINIQGHVEATFPYVLSHLEYIVGELLRNSIQAVMQNHEAKRTRPPPIEVLICEAPEHVVIRFSDQGGGIPRDILPFLWSFHKGPRRAMRLGDLRKVPAISATMQEVQVPTFDDVDFHPRFNSVKARDKSLINLSLRHPDVRLGLGLPMSRVYAEYWAGSLALHSLEGYGVDAFLQISKLGNQNEQLTSRASIDAV